MTGLKNIFINTTKAMNTEQFLKSKGIIKEGFSKWVATFEDGSQVDIGQLMDEYSKAYATECIKASFKKAVENIEEHNINNPENIVLL